jgi:hypothetical protein
VTTSGISSSTLPVDTASVDRVQRVSATEEQPGPARQRKYYEPTARDPRNEASPMQNHLHRAHRCLKPALEELEVHQPLAS